jgi:hypothetical protein
MNKYMGVFSLSEERTVREQMDAEYIWTQETQLQIQPVKITIIRNFNI